MRRNPPIRSATFAAVCAVALLTACARRTGTLADNSNAPCVLLVTMDGLRADRVGCYGYTNAFTPVLDGLAQQGTRFADLLAVAPLSLPAHASILTGLLPPEHGLRVPGGGPLPKVPTLATALQAKGYRTGAFLASAELGQGSGLDRGFERYDLPPPVGGNATGRTARAGMRLRPKAFPADAQRGTRRGEQVTDAALAWLADVTGAPKESRRASPAERREASAKDDPKPPRAEPLKPKQPFFLWLQLADIGFADALAHTRAEGGRTVDAYGAEVAYMDLQLGRILAFLSHHGLRMRTFVVVVGSHGQELGPDAGADPGLVLSDATLHVPGILAGQGVAVGAPDLTINQSCIAPTVAALFGCLDALDPRVAARSLREDVAGLQISSTAPAYVESWWPQHAYGLPPLRGWVCGDRRYSTGRGAELREAPIAVDTVVLSEESAAILSGKVPGNEALARLEAAFDTTGAAPQPAPLATASFALPPEWDRAEFVALWQRVALRMRKPATDDATLLGDCQRLVEGRPDYAPFRTWIGIAHTLHKQFAEAVAAQREAVRLAPGTPYLLSNLGLAYLDANDIVNAIDNLEDAYLARPDDPEFRDNLAAVLMNTGVALAKNKAFNDAMACMTRVLLLQPDNPVAHANMGSVYQGMGRADLAANSYRRALELNPGLKPAKRALDSLKEPQ